MPFAFAPVTPGAFRARYEWDGGQRVLLLTGATGAPLSSVDSRVTEVARGRNRLDAMVVAALGGTWVLPEPPAREAPETAVLDAAGQPVGAIRHHGKKGHEIVLAAGALRLEFRRGNPQYRIDGMFSAGRTLRHVLMPALAGDVFLGETTARLAGVPDASLILGLAALLSWRAIRQKEEDEAWRQTR